jgi:hypothetical protein
MPLSIIRTPQQYFVNNMVRNVQDAMITLGEECITLTMYHIGDDEKTQPRCDECYDTVYKSSETFNCPECYGTTFAGGVKQAYRAMAIFSDAPNFEDFKKVGESDFQAHKIQLEATPHLKENDYVVRVLEWEPTLVGDDIQVPYPRRIGPIYALDSVKEITLRTGTRYGQNGTDKIGHTSTAHELPRTHPIYNYVIPEPVLRVDEEIV